MSAEVIVKESPIKGKGLFAGENIPKGTKIIEYVGEKISKKEGEKRSDIQESTGKPMTIFELNKSFDIDGSVGGNGAEYANHSCQPNAETETIKGHIWIKAIKSIKEGEEICYDYRYAADADPDPCKCGNQRCRGTINLIDKRKKKKKTKKSLATPLYLTT